MDTYALLSQVKDVAQVSPFYAEEDLNEFLYELIQDVCARKEIIPSIPLGEALWETIRHLLYLEGFLLHIPDDLSIEHLTLEEGVVFRASLKRHLRFLSQHERLLPVWREKLAIVLSAILEYFPLSAFTDIDERGIAADDSVILPEAKAYDLCDNLPEVVERLMVTFFDEDVRDAHLFDALRERFDNNLLFASGIPLEKRHEATSRKITFPMEQREKSPEHLVNLYLNGTPFAQLFDSPLPFAIPFPARFEHTHIVGGTGHGKTQLIQFLINHDLVRSQEDGRSVVVIDSQGDLIRTISRLGYFSPSAEGSLADRLVIIDPTDIEYPVCLNMFDFNRDRLSGYTALDREKILNATVELYEYFFGALLGAELTQRQGLIFRYLARLMIEIPDATIHTFRELMEHGERFKPYMEKLQGTTRSFFETRFFDRQFNETKKQILTRLWGVLSSASIERMFSHPRSKIDVFELLNQGKIILINTAKDLLGQEGTAIFGRFFISLIAQAAIQRATIPAHERRPSFVYIDEAQDYFDDNISHLLSQARKYRVGLIFAHQNLDQLGAGLRASVLSSTSIKFAGGVSAKDAHALDTEMRCGPEFLLAQKKGRNHTEFACYVKSHTAKALSVRIPFGYVEALPTLTYADHQYLLEENRNRYSEPVMLPTPSLPVEPIPPSIPKPPTQPKREKVGTPSVSEPESISPSPRRENPPPVGVEPTSKVEPRSRATKKQKTILEQGRGGKQHKYLQHLIKQLAEERGFRAAIEETILDGAGRIDVAVTHGEVRVAFEISVTTNQDHELGNIEKCFAAGYSHVVLVGKSERHIKTLATFIEENLDEANQGKARYIAPEALVEYFDTLPLRAPREQTVRGYKVKVSQATLSPADVAERRAAIAQVIARSLSKAQKD
ncbi:MAG: type IV secretion system DNA-binding domain-containing protein [Gammaproteobacteria bacterium]|nr:type IV secretion system DNA-binding domain-containing protein [Gammaproteobacteria bacterium]